MASGSGGGEPGLGEDQGPCELHEFDDHEPVGGQPPGQPPPQPGPPFGVEVAEDSAEQDDADPVGEIKVRGGVRGDGHPGTQVLVAEDPAGEHGAHADRRFAGDDLRVRPGPGDGLGHQAGARTDVDDRPSAQIGVGEERGDRGGAGGRGVLGGHEVEELGRRRVRSGVRGSGRSRFR